MTVGQASRRDSRAHPARQGWVRPAFAPVFLRFIVLLVSVGFLGACAAAPHARFPSTEEALLRLLRQSDCSRAVTGEARLVVQAPIGGASTQMLYKAKAPDHLRFDLYSEFGVTLATFTTDSKKYALYNLSERSFAYGPARTCSLEEFTQVPIPPFSLVEILRGRPPLLEHDPRRTEIRYARPWFSEARYVVKLWGEHETFEKIEFSVHPEDRERPLSQQRLRLLSVRIEQAGSLLYRADLSDYRPGRREPIVATPEEKEMGIAPPPPSGPACESELPGRIKFKVPGRSYTLVLETKQASHNPPIGDADFTQTPPAGVVARQYDCGSGSEIIPRKTR